MPLPWTSVPNRLVPAPGGPAVPHPGPPRPVLAVLLTCLVAVLAGCAASESMPAQPTPAPGDVRPVAVTDTELAGLPEASTFGDVPDAPVDPAPHDPGTGTVVRAHAEVPVYGEPGGAPVARLPERQLGSPTWLPVVDRAGDWLQVLLPSRPNGSTGWLHADDDLEEAGNDFLVTVDLADFALTVTREGEEIGRWTVGVGSAEAPTPTGRTFVMASIQETVTDFSPYTLPLGAHSDTHQTYAGGPGTVAIHGWPDETPFGTETSDGCVRVPDDALDLLITLPLGTVVLVR
ncbi:L,D-transpeptidase [Actinoalloteichus caeruleus]|uniref:L,D-transpeptidase catalytic domain n=1 Tax=Actinoalloteichus caeruleus DSM 43889 TaxID=1120930 RepID=A0ABT1JMK7_ACTCY|nr:L,D-transpeptidase family protein [Actinoalloteichus caeruleus]MCP2333758.1 L,D-transpeptidase catalytic domain [Actinoalloteichus caeruleus DSM 43889]